MKHGREHMRAPAFATFALALVACSGQPLGQQWQVDKEGKPIPGTERPLWNEDEVVAVRQAFTFNVAYNLDCGIKRTPFHGEVLLFDGTNFTAECKAIRVAGGEHNPPQNLVIDYVDPTARWLSGKSWNDQVGSMMAKPLGFVTSAGGEVGMCIRLRQHANGSDSPGWGNGGSAFWDVPIGTELHVATTFPFLDASFIVVRAKGLGEGTCPI